MSPFVRTNSTEVAQDPVESNRPTLVSLKQNYEDLISSSNSYPFRQQQQQQQSQQCLSSSSLASLTAAIASSTSQITSDLINSTSSSNPTTTSATTTANPNNNNTNYLHLSTLGNRMLTDPLAERIMSLSTYQENNVSSMPEGLIENLPTEGKIPLPFTNASS